MERAMQVLSYKHSRGEAQVVTSHKTEVLDNLPKNRFIICDDFFSKEIIADYYYQAIEQHKTQLEVDRIITLMEEKEVSRNTTLVTIGGGSTGDLGGFIASTYMRGLDWINIPTTLLSQVDSCLGGKVGINTVAGKNLIGSFHHPSQIKLCHDFLNSLDTRSIKSGWGEIYKYSLIDTRITVNQSKGVPSEKQILDCLKVKADIIEVDELDKKGDRAILNLGHTLGHAIEKVSGYSISHGEAVWWGLLFEAFIETKQIKKSLLRFEPDHQQLVLRMKASELAPYIKRDKKGSYHFFNDKLNVVILNESSFANLWREFILSL